MIDTCSTTRTSALGMGGGPRLFELVARWAELAETEIQAWPQTDGLGMTERTQALLEELVRRPGPAQAAARLPDGAASE